MAYPPLKPWFAPKRHGYGAGMPVAWQGWLVLVLFTAAIVVAAVRLAGVDRILAFAVLLVALIAICAAKTEGGWRWRGRY
jgi:uncharacterized membrane protein